MLGITGTRWQYLWMASAAAIILCGGRGTRLGSIGLYTPKWLLDVGGQPPLTRQLEQFQGLGIRRPLLAVGHLSGYVRQAVLSRTAPSQVEFIRSPDLGTGGAILAALSNLETGRDYVWVSMGDIVCEADLAAMWSAALRSGASAVILAAWVNNPAPFGVVRVDADGWLLSFEEKSITSGPALVDAGYYLFRSDFLDAFKDRKTLSLEYDVFPNAKKVLVVPHRGPWFDIGTQERLAQARRAFSSP